MSKISLQMYTMRDYIKTKPDLTDTVRKLSQIGFKNLQYTVQSFMTIKETKELFDEFGISQDSDCISFYDIENNLKRVENGAKYFKTPYLRCDSMPREMATPDGIKGFCDEANRIGKLISQFGQKLLYHFHSYEFINFEGRYENGIDIFKKELNPEYVLFQPDTHWIQCGGENPAEFIRENADLIGYVHVKDYAIGKRDELLESTPKLYAPVGCGNLNFKEIIKACKEINCEMYVIEQDDCYGKSPFECVQTSFNNLKKLGVS
ncbi:MAG: sugar phosphate isomerase/epimerase [Eubacteriales bacterium]|nr:sugar phosphate isomerase/epimerase [Clostridia bacterium]MDY4214494.1 sugar phosphate isomerase/epimerase [Eubacteriales bacterium]